VRVVSVCVVLCKKKSSFLWSRGCRYSHAFPRRSEVREGIMSSVDCFVWQHDSRGYSFLNSIYLFIYLSTSKRAKRGRFPNYNNNTKLAQNKYEPFLCSSLFYLTIRFLPILLDIGHEENGNN
jgi:hypothetical protein